MSCTQFGYIRCRLENVQSLAIQLLGAARAAILPVLFLRPEESMHVREIARDRDIAGHAAS
jgi:hypothetical protein